MNILTSFVAAFLEVISVVLNLYVWALVIGAVLSWLAAFDIVNTRSRFVQVIGDFIYRITEPALRPIRKFLPVMGGVDLSPLVLILIILFVQSFISHLAL